MTILITGAFGQLGQVLVRKIGKSKEDVIIELRWASIKLLKLELKNEFPYLKKLIDLGEKFKKEMDKKCESVESEDALKELIGNYNNPETKKIIKNYYLQYNAQKICSDYIYNETSELKTPIEIDGEIQKNIFFYSNVANYFSSEAYYTSSAVNSIVVENQIKTELDKEDRPEYVIKGIYLTAAIENFGDMINHMEHENGDVKKTIIKYSKYLYRIYFVLSKIDKKYEDKANQLKEHVIPYRATYDIDKANKNGIWEYVYYNNESKSEYMNKIKEKIGGKLEGILEGMKEIHVELDNNGYPIKEDKKIELENPIINKQDAGPLIINKIGSGGKKKRSKSKKRYRKRRKTIRKKRRGKKERSIKYKH